MQQESILETLRKCMFFNHLAEEQLRSVAAMGVMQSYNAGDELFRQGTLGTNLYILSRGQISLDREVRLGDNRKGIVSVHEARERPHGSRKNHFPFSHPVFGPSSTAPPSQDPQHSWAMPAVLLNRRSRI